MFPSINLQVTIMTSLSQLGGEINVVYSEPPDLLGDGLVTVVTTYQLYDIWSGFINKTRLSSISLTLGIIQTCFSCNGCNLSLHCLERTSRMLNELVDLIDDFV